MPGSWDALRSDSPVEINHISEAELERRAHRDLASISDELTDAMQAATCYIETVRRLAQDSPPILDKRHRDILVLAMDQIARANRAIKGLHDHLAEGSRA